MRTALALVLALVLTSLSVSAVKAASSWDPIDPSELAATEPRAGEKADLEALFCREDLEDIDRGSRRSTTFRLKIYTARGVERLRKESILVKKGENATELRARVVKQDGRILEVGSDAFVHTRSSARDDRSEGSVTYTLPELAPGDIVDFSYTITHYTESVGYAKIVQQWYPIRNYIFNVKVRDEFRAVFSNFKGAETSRKGNKATLRINQMPAYVEEPHMPPIMDVAIAVGTVTVFENMPSNELWPRYLGFYANRLDENATPDRAIKNEVTRLTAGAKTPLEKLRVLYRYCQNEILHIDQDASPAAKAEELRREKEDRGPYDAQEVFKAKKGTANETILLFRAMARSAGLDSKLLLLSGKDSRSGIETEFGWAFASEMLLYFDLGSEQIFLWPGDRYLAFGDVPSYMQGAKAAIAEAKGPQFVQIPINPPEECQREYTGDFQLNEEGELSGTVQFRCSGQFAWNLRTAMADADSVESFNSSFIAKARKDIPSLELTELQWSGDQSSEGDLVLKARLAIPNYVEMLGDRASFIANPLLMGAKPAFTAETRVHPMAYDFTGITKVRSVIHYPTTWTSESVSTPPTIGTEKTVIGITYRVSHDAERKTITAESDFILGRGATKEFPVKAYPVVKRFFELKAKQDEHRVLFKIAP